MSIMPRKSSSRSPLTLRAGMPPGLTVGRRHVADRIRTGFINFATLRAGMPAGLTVGRCHVSDRIRTGFINFVTLKIEKTN